MLGLEAHGQRKQQEAGMGTGTGWGVGAGAGMEHRGPQEQSWGLSTHLDYSGERKHQPPSALGPTLDSPSMLCVDESNLEAGPGSVVA